MVYRDYYSAVNFVHQLNLNSFLEWQKYINGDFPDLPSLPNNIPSNPYRIYKNIGWINWEKWLGNEKSNAEYLTPLVENDQLDAEIQELYGKIDSNDPIIEVVQESVAVCIRRTN